MVAIPNMNYRESSSRAVYIQGVIDEDLVVKLTPQINELRLASTESITLYLNSSGGDTDAAETISKLITAPHPDGGRCQLVTAVTGQAASAAADLLASGDYAIAYPHAKIMYHGVSALRRVTTEGAALLASDLKRVNERYAEQLAARTFGRFFLRILDFQNELNQYRDTANRALAAAALIPLINCIRQKVNTPTEKALEQALSRLQSIVSLEKTVFGLIEQRSTDLSTLSDSPKWDAEMLKAIVDHKAETNVHNMHFFTSGGGAQETLRDFELLNDYFFGRLRNRMKRQFSNYGEMLLNAEGRSQFPNLTLTDPEKAEWLENHVGDKLFLLWYFVMSLCRILQTSDHEMTPVDAYWIGLVDEVPGSGLWNVRNALEKVPQSATP